MAIGARKIGVRGEELEKGRTQHLRRKKGTDTIRAVIHAKDTDENYLAVWQARETVENGLRLGAVGNLISTTVLTARPEPSGGHEAVERSTGHAGDSPE